MVYHPLTVLLIWAIATLLVSITLILWDVGSSHYVLVYDTGSYEAGISTTLHGPTMYDRTSTILCMLVVIQEVLVLHVVPCIMYSCIYGPRSI